MIPEAGKLFADLQEATPRTAGQWEQREEHFDSGTLLYEFWTPKGGAAKFKITIRLIPEDDDLSVRAYCEPNHTPQASVLPVDSDPKMFPIADFDQVNFAEWLHGRLQKCANIALAILRPQ